MSDSFIPSAPRFSIVILAIAAVSAACATTKRKTPVVTYPFEPGVGACRATIETSETKGLIRYVAGPEATREIWDVDSDGTPERELRKIRDSKGRVVTIEQFDATGRVVQRIEREWEGDRLLAERGDRWDEQGRPGPDGKPDWIRQLEWDEGRLTTVYVDETDEEGLPGIDGEPEFVTSWTWENGRRVSGEKRHDGLIVATFEREYSGERLKREAIDWGDDGRVEEQTTYEYDSQGRVRRLEHREQGGGYVTTYSYQCSG